MSKKSPGKKDKASVSTAAALTTLVGAILELLEAGGLDGQFASKLSRRIAREADDAGLSTSQHPEGLGLLLKLQELDTAITQTRANGLLAAMANLRLADESEAN